MIDIMMILDNMKKKFKLKDIIIDYLCNYVKIVKEKLQNY